MAPKYKILIAVILAMLVPSAGHVYLGRPVRGLMLVFWMFALGFITYKLSPEGASFVGRFAGGFAVWVLSVVDVASLGKKKFLLGRL